MDRITALIEPILADMGFDLVRVQVTGGASRPKVQVMAEPLDGRVMEIEDCEKLSRQISAVLDVEDPIHGAYDLEVSSPGLERPLTRLQDYVRFRGSSAKMELKTPLAGRKHFKGQILDIKNEDIIVKTQDTDEEITLPYAMISKAKLLLTDELLRAALGRQRKEKKQGKSIKI